MKTHEFRAGQVCCRVTACSEFSRMAGSNSGTLAKPTETAALTRVYTVVADRNNHKVAVYRTA